MDLIKLFYQRVRVKQLLHVFIQAQIRNFEYIPFIENNTLVQNSFHKNIVTKATKTLDHISNDMCSPYKKHKTHNNSNCKIENLQKYSVYLLKNKNKTDLNNEEPIKKPDSSQSEIPDKLSSSLSFENKTVNIGDLTEKPKYTIQVPSIFKSDFPEHKSRFIENILSFVMKTDYNNIKGFIYLDENQTTKQEGVIDYIKLNIGKAVIKANEEPDSQQAYKNLLTDIVNIAETYYNEFKENNLDMKVFQETVFDEFTNSELKLTIS